MTRSNHRGMCSFASDRAYAIVAVFDDVPEDGAVLMNTRQDGYSLHQMITVGVAAVRVLGLMEEFDRGDAHGLGYVGEEHEHLGAGGSGEVDTKGPRTVEQLLDGIVDRHEKVYILWVRRADLQKKFTKTFKRNHSTH